MKRSLIGSVTSLFSMTDEQAMWRVHGQDDAQAFAQLMRRWQGPIQKLCTRMLGDQQRGEDLMQETFARLFAKRKEYQPTGRFSTYLWRMALNLCYDELRRRKRRPEAPLTEDGADGAEELMELRGVEPGADVLLLRRERSEIVRRAVLRLPEAYRSVVVLRHYEDLKFREIAEVLGVPEGTVKSRMAEALSQLHRSLSGLIEEKNLCQAETKSEAMAL